MARFNSNLAMGRLRTPKKKGVYLVEIDENVKIRATVMEDGVAVKKDLPAAKLTLEGSDDKPTYLSQSDILNFMIEEPEEEKVANADGDKQLCITNNRSGSLGTFIGGRDFEIEKIEVEEIHDGWIYIPAINPNTKKEYGHSRSNIARCKRNCVKYV